MKSGSVYVVGLTDVEDGHKATRLLVLDINTSLQDAIKNFRDTPEVGYEVEFAVGMDHFMSSYSSTWPMPVIGYFA